MTKPLAAAAAFGILFTAACSRTRVEAGNAPAAQTQAPTVAVAQVKTQNLARTLTLTAEFKPYQEVDVMAKIAGYIKQINVDIGDRVSEGPAAGHARNSRDGRRSAPRQRVGGPQPGAGACRRRMS